MPLGDSSTNQLLEQLITKQEAANEALLRVSEHAEQTNKSLHGLDRTFAPLKLLSGIIQKILTATVGNAIKFDKMAVANADININLKHLQRGIVSMGSNIGTITDHTEVAIQLHRVGYKTLDKDFQDSLVLLNKQGGQGDELIAFMGELLSKGASQKTQLAVAKAIAKVADNTTTTAHAAIASLSELADLQPLFKALGFGGQTLEFLAKRVESMTKEGGVAIGKALKSLMDDHGPIFWLTGGREIANAIFNAKSQKDFNKGVASLLDVSVEITKFGKLYGQDVVLGKAFNEQMFGAYANTIIIAAEADKVRKSNMEDEIKNTQKYIKGSEAYNKSLTTAFDLVTKVGEVGGIALLEAVGPLVTALTKFSQQYLSDANLFEQIVNVGQSIGEWGGQITDWLTVMRSSNFYAWVSGQKTWQQAIGSRGGASQFAQDLVARGGDAAGVPFKENRGRDKVSWGGTLTPAETIREFGAKATNAIAAGFLDDMKDISDNADFFGGDSDRSEWAAIREVALRAGGGLPMGESQLGFGASRIGGTSKSGLRTATGEGAGDIISFTEAINNSKDSIEKYLREIGVFHGKYQAMLNEGWTLQERKVGDQSDWELVSKDAASAKSRTEAQKGGFIPSMQDMSPEEFIKKLSNAIWDVGREKGDIHSPVSKEGFLTSLIAERAGF